MAVEETTIDIDQEIDTALATTSPVPDAAPAAEAPTNAEPDEAQEVNSNPGVAADADAAVVELSIAEQWAIAEKAAKERHDKWIAALATKKRPDDVLPLADDSAVPEKLGVITDFYEVDVREDEEGPLAAIAAGQYGQIFSGITKDAAQERRAVKRIPFDNVENVGDFQRELAIHKLMKHPNICTLHDNITDNGGMFWYLVMDLMSGGDLIDELVRRKECVNSIAEDTMARYAYEMLDGIRYCHFHNIVHRDIKCENYMLEFGHERAPVKLIDFGLAIKQIPGEQMTEIVGTLSLVAPEVLNASYDEKCDIWSIGITVYMLAMAKQPFASGNEQALLKMIKAGPDFDASCRRDKTLWDRVIKTSSDGRTALELIRPMMSVDPKERPSAESLLKTCQWLERRGTAAARGTVDEMKPFFDEKPPGCCQIFCHLLGLRKIEEP